PPSTTRRVLRTDQVRTERSATGRMVVPPGDTESRNRPGGQGGPARGRRRVNRSPRVRLGRGAARAREDIVELLHRRVVQLDLEGAQRAIEVLARSRADDRRRDHRVREDPRERDVRGLFAELLAELLVALEARSVLLDRALRELARAPPLAWLVE